MCECVYVCVYEYVCVCVHVQSSVCMCSYPHPHSRYKSHPTQVFSHLVVAHHKHNQHPLIPTPAQTALLRVLSNRVLVDAHLVAPQLLQDVAASVAAAAQVLCVCVCARVCLCVCVFLKPVAPLIHLGCTPILTLLPPCFIQALKDVPQQSFDEQDLQQGAKQAKQSHSRRVRGVKRSKRKLLEGMLPLDQGAYLLQVLFCFMSVYKLPYEC